MKINNNTSLASAGATQATSAATPSNLVDRIMTHERQAVQHVQTQRDELSTKKERYSSFVSMVSDLGSSAQGLKRSDTFQKLKVESSHPDILSGDVSGLTATGSYEFEVKATARGSRTIMDGFPDVDQTPVGFGFVAIGDANGDKTEITINPGSTLNDVASQINDQMKDVRAVVVNTGKGEDPYKLMVKNLKTGLEQSLSIDTDTTYLETDRHIEGSNAELNFEGVDISRADNKVNDLIPGLAINAKKAAAGTQIRLDVTTDIDATVKGVEEFVSKYNKVANFAHQEFQINPQTGRFGDLADGNLRSVMRSLQSGVASQSSQTGSFRTLADVGITTDAKTGELKVDDNKLRSAVSSDAKGVASLFAESEQGDGVAARLSRAVKQLQDPQTGVLKLREKSLSQSITNQDRDIENRTRQLEERETRVRQQIQSMDARVQELQSQQAQMQTRLLPGGQG